MKKPSYWTIQAFPEGSGRAHNFRLRPRILHLSIVLLLGLVGLSSAWVLGFLGQRLAISELDRYKAENQHLVSNLQAMGQLTERLTYALDGLAAKDQRFRVVAGLPLLDREPLCLVVLIIDSRHGATPLDEQMREWLTAHDKPFVVVASKSDKLKAAERVRALRTVEQQVGSVLPFSAKTAEGLPALWGVIREALAS